jgi:hypothetical protein
MPPPETLNRFISFAIYKGLPGCFGAVAELDQSVEGVTSIA